jgi:hypothetical protein
MTTQPENHVEAPDLAALVTTAPGDPKFWQEVGKAFDWVKYVWVGPTPNVTIDLNNVYAGRRFSSQTIYEEIIRAVGSLKIPGVICGPQIIHEGGPFSPYRAYLRIRREFSEFLVCAAPVGDSFFVTVRKIDRFRHVKWWHYLIVLLMFLNVLTAAVLEFGITGGVVFCALLVSLLWSLMRYASRMVKSWLGEKLPEIPVIGGIYLRWFRPDTFYRQDLHSAFLVLVDEAIRGVVTGLDPTQPVRPATEHHGGPILKDLHRPG